MCGDHWAEMSVFTTYRGKLIRNEGRRLGYDIGAKNRRSTLTPGWNMGIFTWI
jgi:hypothetical protein